MKLSTVGQPPEWWLRKNAERIKLEGRGEVREVHGVCRLADCAVRVVPGLSSERLAETAP